MNIKKFAVALAIGLGLAGSWATARAAAIGLDQWYAFEWSGTAPVAASACAGGCVLLTGAIDAPADSPWTISGAIKIRITDAFLAVDQFALFDNAGSVGTTSAYSGDTTDTCGPSVEDCYNSADFSHGVFYLGGGNHSLTISTVAGSSAGGAAYFRAELIPEPGTLALLGLGIAGLAASRRRKR